MKATSSCFFGLVKEYYEKSLLIILDFHADH